ncbi:hypothetical protein ACEQPO_06460 [Bacillus sp. SL00103]
MKHGALFFIKPALISFLIGWVLTTFIPLNAKSLLLIQMQKHKNSNAFFGAASTLTF